MQKAFGLVKNNLPALFWFALLAVVLSESLLLAVSTWKSTTSARSSEDEESREMQFDTSSVCKPAGVSFHSGVWTVGRALTIAS